MADELMQAESGFMCTVGGVSILVSTGDVYPSSDPVVAASPLSFRTVRVLNSADRLLAFNRPRGAAVETATAAPGEHRTLTAPADVAARPAATGKQPAAKKAPAAAAAGSTPSEV